MFFSNLFDNTTFFKTSLEISLIFCSGVVLKKSINSGHIAICACVPRATQYTDSVLSESTEYEQVNLSQYPEEWEIG